MATLGSRIKNLREKQDIKQVDFAKKLGVSNVVLSRYESDERKPDYETLQTIADFFDVSTDYLLGRIEKSNGSRIITVAGKEVSLSTGELEVFKELKKHPTLFHDLASNPEKKVKELIKLYTMKKMFLEDDDKDPGDGFGSLKD